MSLAHLNSHALAVIPTQIARAHETAIHACAVADKRRRKILRSLFTSEAEDEFHERLRAIARCVDELACYIVYRHTRPKSLEAAFQTKLALRQQYMDWIEKLIASGKIRNDSISVKNDDGPLFASIDESEQCVAGMDAAALGLIATYNDLVRELKHFSSQHMLSIPRSQPIPQLISTE